MKIFYLKIGARESVSINRNSAQVQLKKDSNIELDAKKTSTNPLTKSGSRKSPGTKIGTGATNNITRKTNLSETDSKTTEISTGPIRKVEPDDEGKRRPSIQLSERSTATPTTTKVNKIVCDEPCLPDLSSMSPLPVPKSLNTDVLVHATVHKIADEDTNNHPVRTSTKHVDETISILGKFSFRITMNDSSAGTVTVGIHIFFSFGAIQKTQLRQPEFGSAPSPAAGSGIRSTVPLWLRSVKNLLPAARVQLRFGFGA